VQFFDGEATVKDRVWYGAAYAQDQWTFRRFTLSGAVRYDHAASRYLGTCIGASSEPYMPTQTDGSKSYCTKDSSGVSFDDITPRWGATYDLMGNGKTSIKLNMGKYNNQAAITGIYSGANPRAPHGQLAAARVERHRRRPHRRLRPHELSEQRRVHCLQQHRCSSGSELGRYRTIR
jgi:hypothetical protein